jgi:hypothetical protein
VEEQVKQPGEGGGAKQPGDAKHRTPKA